jgi:hypothetical protein
MENTQFTDEERLRLSALVGNTVAAARRKGPVPIVVNYVIDKREKVIHAAKHVPFDPTQHVTAEHLNPAYVESHGYVLCKECFK